MFRGSLGEQHRIVAKVDELMTLCDELEAARTKREAMRNRLTTASLARLSDLNAETFEDDMRFALDVLPSLTMRRDQIRQLRQTILYLAVQGLLVPQCNSDGTAKDDLLAMNGDWEAVESSDGEGEEILPRGWQQVTMEQCFIVTGGIQKTPARAPRQHAFPYLSVANVHRNRLSLAEVKKFELSPAELDRYRLQAGDILVVEGNGSASEIGRCAAWGDEIQDCVHQNHLIRCRPLSKEITPYVLLYLNSPAGIELMKQLAITSTGLFSLSVGKIRKLTFPLPPVTEQHRIVAKVDKLTDLCDQLEASISTADDTRRRLLDALLAEALHSPLLAAA